MANKASKGTREVRFTLKDDDFKAFGRYRIMYTAQGRKMVMRQRLSYLIAAVMIAILFTVFHVDKSFTYIMYVIAGALAVVGLIFAEKLVLRQQDKAIDMSANSVERVMQEESRVVFGEDTFTTYGNGDEQVLNYKDIKLIDLTEEAIYVWMSDTMIMPLPIHGFRGMPEMKEFYKWIRQKAEEKGADLKQ